MIKTHQVQRVKIGPRNESDFEKWLEAGPEIDHSLSQLSARAMDRDELMSWHFPGSVVRGFLLHHPTDT